MDWNAATAELSKPLDPKHVKKPDGKFGPKGDYIEGWHAIAEANRIFGFGEWSYEIKGLTQDRLHHDQDKDQWQAAYTCLVTLKVGGAVREDVGFGSGFSKQPGDAIEGATKEAVTDALKRALRTFGNPFGLALYDKSRANVQTPEPTAEEMRDKLIQVIDHQPTREVLEARTEKPDFKNGLSKLKDKDEAQALKVVDHLNSRIAALPGLITEEKDVA